MSHCQTVAERDAKTHESLKRRVPDGMVAGGERPISANAPFESCAGLLFKEFVMECLFPIAIGLLLGVVGFGLGAITYYESYKERVRAGMEPFIDSAGSVAWREKEIRNE